MLINSVSKAPTQFPGQSYIIADVSSNKPSDQLSVALSESPEPKASQNNILILASDQIQGTPLEGRKVITYVEFLRLWIQPEHPATLLNNYAVLCNGQSSGTIIPTLYQNLIPQIRKNREHLPQDNQSSG